MEIQKLVSQEIGLINRLLQANKVRARASLKSTAVIEVGYIRYGIDVALDEKFARVEALHREMSALLTSSRRRMGLDEEINVLPTTTPLFALEVPHPNAKPLNWSPRKITTTSPHTMLIGRSYLSGPRDESINFDDTPHALIVGITGAGKTMLLQTMLLSLCAGTSPQDLRLVLVDLKNEDLAPFEKLPHVLTFAGTRDAAIDAIRFVFDEKEKRIEQRGYKPYRLVLVIDEMAQLAGNSAAREMLGDLGSIGRGKLINVIGATQRPTEKGGLGALLKTNFPIRLVGMVAPGQSYIATDRAQTHAELLPGKGAFLRCQGPRVYRFQSYFIDGSDVTNMAKYITRDVWGAHVAPLAPVQNKTAPSLVYAPLAPPHAPVQNDVCTTIAPLFPLTDKRPLTAAEGAEVRRLAAEGTSKNALQCLVYGSRSPRYKGWIDAALGEDDSKIIQLRRAS